MKRFKDWGIRSKLILPLFAVVVLGGGGIFKAIAKSARERVKSRRQRQITGYSHEVAPLVVSRQEPAVLWYQYVLPDGALEGDVVGFNGITSSESIPHPSQRISICLTGPRSGSFMA